MLSLGPKEKTSLCKPVQQTQGIFKYRAMEGGDSSSNVRIEQVYSVSFKNGEPWIPETSEKRGRVFARLHKWCRGFTKFVLNVPMDNRRGRAEPCHVRSQEFIVRFAYYDQPS